MRINHLFRHIKNDKTIEDSSKKQLYAIIRAILANRMTLGLSNNVSEMYKHTEIIEETMGDDFEDIATHLDIVYDIPKVSAYLSRMNDFDDYEDDSYEGSDCDADTDTDDTDDDTDSDGAKHAANDAEDIHVTVNVNMPFSWMNAITLVLSLINLAYLVQMQQNPSKSW